VRRERRAVKDDAGGLNQSSGPWTGECLQRDSG